MSTILKETFLRESQLKNSSHKFNWSKTYTEQTFGQTRVKEVLDEETISQGLGKSTNFRGLRSEPRR
jgi:hypothetical protein